MRWRIIAGSAAVVMAVDQLTKHLVITSLGSSEVISLTSFFNLVNVRNRGAAFGFLNSPDISWQFWFFLLATFTAVGIICFVAKGARETDRFLFAGLGCIMGGALGNLIDRVRFREVIDFLDLHYAQMHWPAFNVADIAICLGAAMTAFYMLRAENGQTPGDSAGENKGKDA